MTLLFYIITYRCKRKALWVSGVRPCEPLRLRFSALKIVRSSRSIIIRHDLKYEGQSSKGAFLTRLFKTGAPNENIVQSHLNIALLNVF